MFSAIDSSGTSASSWWMMMMPSCLAVGDAVELALLALEDDLAVVGAVRIDAADSTFISVDLPAPFSPTTAWISPASTLEIDVRRAP